MDDYIYRKQSYILYITSLQYLNNYNYKQNQLFVIPDIDASQ